MILDVGAALARRLPPEAAHDAGIAGLAVAQAQPWLRPNPPAPPERLRTEIAGMSLPTPIGLAAGFDKDARAPDALLALGFGFVECGTVTPQPQPGNPKPRLFRLPADRAVVNRFGFNSAGLDLFVARLAARRGAGGCVGANVGANKTSEDRAGDYVAGLKAVWAVADYVTVNISSPNTPGLRDLQESAALTDLLGRLEEARAGLAGSGPARPLFLKVAPDLDDDAIDRIAEAARAHGVDALIVSNTTVSRPESLTDPAKAEAGGLSGRPLFALSTRALKHFREATGGRMTLIGAGGVEDGATAYAKIRAGASAVQLYSALVYAGPKLAVRIAADLDARLAADGYESVADAVGADVPV